MAVKSIPGRLIPSGKERIDADIEDSASPHLDRDDEERQEADQFLPTEAKAMEG